MASAPDIGADHSSQQDQHEGAPNRRIAMAVLLMANFMNLIDVTIVNVALPSLQDATGATSTQIEWVVAAYIFVFALWLMPAGRLGDIYGRRRLFLIGVGVFTVASALCGAAWSIETLILARALQGFGGALMTPQTLALVPALFPQHERGGVFALFGLTAGMAAVCGPILGGLLIGADLWGLTWRPIFLVNIPIGMLAIVLALRVVPVVPGHRRLGVDFPGMALAGAALFLMLFPLVEGHAFGWPPWCFAMMAVAVPIASFFVLWQRRQDRRQAAQLLPFRLLTRPSFLMGAGLAAMLFSGVPGFFFVLALFLQVGHGLTPLQSGLTTVPFSLGVLVASILSGRLQARALRMRIAVGAMLMAVGMLALRQTIHLDVATINQLLLGLPLAVAGLGLGTAVSPLFQTVLSDVPGQDSGSASGAVQAIQQVGGAFGVAIMGALFFSALGPMPGDVAYASAMTRAMLYGTVVFAVIAALTFALPRPEPAPQHRPASARDTT